MKKVMAAAVLGLVLLGGGTRAQVAGIAWATYGQGSPFEGWLGPFRPTDTGVDLLLTVLCYEMGSRRKVGAEAVVPIPDGTSLPEIRTLSTTAVVNVCAGQGVTVARVAVILPAVQLGQ